MIPNTASDARPSNEGKHAGYHDAPIVVTSPTGGYIGEDEMLARKLQHLEVAEARAQSLNVLRKPASHQSMSKDFSPHLNPQSNTVSSKPDAEKYRQATVLQLSPNVSPADLAPEVVIMEPPLSPAVIAPEVAPPDLPEALSSGLDHSHTSSTYGLPAAPTDAVSLSAYLERHLQVPYPQQWILPPAINTFHSSFEPASKKVWLDTLDTQSWHTSRCGRQSVRDSKPTFMFTFKSSGGNFRDPKLSWTMSTPMGNQKGPSGTQRWTYKLKIDLKTNIREYEHFTMPNGDSILCTYVHAANYDSLKFLGPDGRSYKWVTQRPVSTLNGSRYDTLRHALFASINPFQDPLFGHIVADHTFWDGFRDRKAVHNGVTCSGCGTAPLVGLRWRCIKCAHHELCEACWISKASVEPTCDVVLFSLPDETLYIRSDSVDVGLVVATLQIMRDWEKVVMREEKRKHPGDFATTVEMARNGDLGRMSYWTSAEIEALQGNNGAQRGDRSPRPGSVH